ncbi:T9SS type A sorting domain-containing protein [Pontibacter sp. H259]|uniref:T9SS type A sorting domain-containing protein n=1 Tax=Pontibacter sp. H259 TaxID=3133421 RepID=UPI0030C29176
MTNIYTALHSRSILSYFRLRLLLVGLLASQVALADKNLHMVPISVEERVRAAEMVVEGEVILKRSFWDARRENIYTSNIIKVYKVFKGTLQQQEVEVITEGGTVGLDKHVYSVALSLNVGQQGVFFLQAQHKLANTPGNNRFSTRPYASEQGFIKYDVASHTAAGVFEKYTSVEQVYATVTRQTKTNYSTIAVNQRLTSKPQQQVHRSVQLPVVTSFTPRTASAGTRTILTINGTNFGSSRGTGFVSFKNADDGGRTFIKAPEDAYLSWTNTQIRMYIPSAGAEDGTAGTGELRITAADGSVNTTTDKLTIIYAYSNLYQEGKSYQPSLIDENNKGGYTIRFAPSMQSRANAQEGFTRAMNSWICNTNINWEIGSPITKESSSADGEVIIMFKSASDVGAGVLARTLSRYRGCSNDQTKEFNWWLSEFDMEINSNISWEYGPGKPTNNQFDFETVMLHELGHAHQLGHVILVREAVMHFELEVRSDYRVLSEADIAGGRFIMARSLELQKTDICPQATMEPKDDLACEITEFKAEYISNEDILLTWKATPETGISRYVIERSANGTTFEEIGTVAAAAENTFTDTDPLPRTAFYRLRVIYTNNEERFSDEISITNPAFLYVFEAGPNPVGDDEKFTIQFIVDKDTPMDLALYDLSGKVVRNFRILFTESNMPLEFDMKGLAAGIYILKWNYSGGDGTLKIVKL